MEVSVEVVSQEAANRNANANSSESSNPSAESENSAYTDETNTDETNTEANLAENSTTISSEPMKSDTGSSEVAPKHKSRSRRNVDYNKFTDLLSDSVSTMNLTFNSTCNEHIADYNVTGLILVDHLSVILTTGF